MLYTLTSVILYLIIPMGKSFNQQKIEKVLQHREENLLRQRANKEQIIQPSKELPNPPPTPPQSQLKKKEPPKRAAIHYKETLDMMGLGNLAQDDDNQSKSSQKFSAEDFI
jgi:hypothetical protein